MSALRLSAGQSPKRLDSKSFLLGLISATVMKVDEFGTMKPSW
jgi:hypothetical protein